MILLDVYLFRTLGSGFVLIFFTFMRFPAATSTNTVRGRTRASDFLLGDYQRRIVLILVLG